MSHRPRPPRGVSKLRFRLENGSFRCVNQGFETPHPVLDNMAIFGAYMYPLWPERAALAETIKAVPFIKEALDWIAADVTRPENEAVWARLEEIEPDRSRIELFDMVWWMYFSPLRGGGSSLVELAGRIALGASMPWRRCCAGKLRTPNKSGGLDLVSGRCRARGRRVAGRGQPRNRTR